MTRAVSTWSLNRTLGRYTGPESSVSGGRMRNDDPGPDTLTLLELPSHLRTRGYDAVQICHFHIPSRESAYLAELRHALAESGITLDALLVDDGDLTHPTEADRHEAWIGRWLDVAAELGAVRARVCAGRSAPNPETIRKGADALVRLAVAHQDVRVVTENWLELMIDASVVIAVRERTGDRVGLLIDLGNWSGTDKYDELAKIAPIAETCHAKCRFFAGGPDREDYERALRVLHDAGYDGPLSLIYDGPDDDEWAALDLEWEIVQSAFR